MPPKNKHEFREQWLSSAVAMMRPSFEAAGLTIPDKLRCGFGLSSTGAKATRKGECWPASASGDEHTEIFISPLLEEPAEVLGELMHALVHACLPADAGHGPKFRDAALKLGLQGKMRHALPGHLLTDTIARMAQDLGPLPHATLDILNARVLDRPMPADKPKKQGTRMLKAECSGEGCGYTVRLAAKWVKDVGPPHCPKHGPMSVALPSEQPDEAEGEAGERLNAPASVPEDATEGYAGSQ